MRKLCHLLNQEKYLPGSHCTIIFFLADFETPAEFSLMEFCLMLQVSDELYRRVWKPKGREVN
jgi:hypothetical protein